MTKSNSTNSNIMDTSLKDSFFQFLKRYRGKQKSFIIPGILVLFLIVFKEKTVEIINAVLVKPLFSTLVQSNTLIDIVCLTGAAVVIGFFCIKAKKMVNLPMSMDGYIISFTILFLFFRLQRHPNYSFVRFCFAPTKEIYLADIFLSFIVGLLFYCLFFCVQIWRKQNVVSTSGIGFFTDSPLSLVPSNDLLDRIGYVTDLKEKILSTNSTTNSFAIGVIGNWGSGKTTFLKTLQSQMGGEAEVVQIHFNPWNTRNIDNITAIFFADLSAKLSVYDYSLRTAITEYCKELIKAIDGSGVEWLKKLIEFSGKEKELQEQFESINESIQRLGKKIVVYIDDVDRLDRKEVIEVLRIIRNTANFGSVFFVVAFDKSYVTTSINDALQSGRENYLEKIFQLEYYLPVSVNSSIYKTTLLNTLRTFVPQEHQSVLNIIENPPVLSLSNHENIPPIEKYILNFRDVNRFMNVFLLNYDRIKQNIYLPDFISISLLRLKFPEVYTLFYYQKIRFLTTTTDSTISFFEREIGELRLRVITQGKTDNDNFELHAFMKNHFPQLAMNSADIENAMMLVRLIFDPTNRVSSFGDKRTLVNHHLTIVNNFYFNRYFDFSLVGRLDQEEFSLALELPLPELEKKIDEWSNTRAISTDLIIKFENLNTFNNRQEFEKLIRAMVFFCYLPVPDSNYLSNYINTDNFFNKFGSTTYEDRNEVVENFYAGNKGELQDFFRSLFFDNSLYRGKWGFLEYFVEKVSKEYDDTFILSKEELKKLIADDFIDILSRTGTITKEIFDFYNHAIRLFTNTNNTEGHIVPIGSGIEITKVLQDLIETNIKMFLEWNIFCPGRGQGYFVGNWHQVIYGSESAFKIVLEKFKDKPEVQEFENFWEATKKANKAIPFPFKVLDILGYNV